MRNTKTSDELNLNEFKGLATIEARAKWLQEAFGNPTASGDYSHGSHREHGSSWVWSKTAGRLSIEFKVFRENQQHHNDPNDWGGDQVTQMRYLDRGGVIRQGVHNKDIDVARGELDLNRDLESRFSDTELFGDDVLKILKTLELRLFGKEIDHSNPGGSMSLDELTDYLIENEGSGVEVPSAWFGEDQWLVDGVLTAIPKLHHEDEPSTVTDEWSTAVEEIIKAEFRTWWNSEDYDRRRMLYHWKALRSDPNNMAVPVDSNDGRYDVRLHKAQVGDLYDMKFSDINFIYRPSDDAKEELLQIENLEEREAALIKRCNEQLDLYRAYLNAEIYEASWKVEESVDTGQSATIAEYESDQGFSSFWATSERLADLRTAEDKLWEEPFHDLAVWLGRRLSGEVSPKLGDPLVDLVQVVREKDDQRAIYLEKPPVERSDDFEQGRFICSVPIGTKVDL